MEYLQKNRNNRRKISKCSGQSIPANLEKNIVAKRLEDDCLRSNIKERTFDRLYKLSYNTLNFTYHVIPGRLKPYIKREMPHVQGVLERVGEQYIL